MQPMQPAAPGKKGLWIGALLISVGVVGGIALIVFGAKSATDTVNHYQRVDAQLGGTVTFSTAGRYDAYFERPGIRRRSQLPPIHVIVSGPGGEQTLDSDISRTSTTEHYTFGDHEGVRLTRFTISQPGAYRIRIATVGEPSVGTAGEIAFGKGSITSGLLSVVGGLFGGGLIAFVGLIVLITSAVRRGRYRKRMAQSGYGGGYGNGYGSGYGVPAVWPPAGPGSPAQTWPPPIAQPARPGPPAPVGQPPQPGQPPGWAPPPTQPPGPAGPVWPPSGPPTRSGPTSDPDRPGWGGPGQ